MCHRGDDKGLQRPASGESVFNTNHYCYNLEQHGSNANPVGLQRFTEFVQIVSDADLC